MDGTENGLAGRSELTKETDDIESGLTIETRRRLIEEQEEPLRQSAPYSPTRKDDQEIPTWGFAASSTPMVRRLRASTLRPKPMYPIIASARSCSSRSSMISSTY